MGKLIVLEGLDGSGKTTQTQLLTEKLSELGNRFIRVDFPDYESDSSALVKHYLQGDYGKDPKAVNPYAAASFFAVDRFAHFQTKWREFYQQGGLVLANRYTTANLVHQSSKLPAEEWPGFMDWLEDYEYKKLGLPRPDLVIYLDLDPMISQNLLSGRYGGDEAKKDIHERDVAYLKTCRLAALAATEHSDWHLLKAWKDGQLRSREEMHEAIWQVVAPYLQNWGYLPKGDIK